MVLTVAYMLTENDNLEWLEEMLSRIRHLPYPIVQFPGIIGDLALARSSAYASIKTEYVLMIDPDDIVSSEAIEECLNFLLDNLNYAACCPQEVSIGINGKFRSSYPKGQYDFNRHLVSTLEFHNGAVFKTSAIMEFLPVLKEANFYDIDWALKLCIANKYPVKKLNMTGSYFRRKPNSHHTGILMNSNQVSPMGTVNRLRELGLINRAVK